MNFGIFRLHGERERNIHYMIIMVVRIYVWLFLHSVNAQKQMGWESAIVRDSIPKGASEIFLNVHAIYVIVELSSRLDKQHWALSIR